MISGCATALVAPSRDPFHGSYWVLPNTRDGATRAVATVASIRDTYCLLNVQKMK